MINFLLFAMRNKLAGLGRNTTVVCDDVQEDVFAVAAANDCRSAELRTRP
jgi:hypothetical protein